MKFSLFCLSSELLLVNSNLSNKIKSLPVSPKSKYNNNLTNIVYNL